LQKIYFTLVTKVSVTEQWNLSSESTYGELLFRYQHFKGIYSESEIDETDVRFFCISWSNVPSLHQLWFNFSIWGPWL